MRRPCSDCISARSSQERRRPSSVKRGVSGRSGASSFGRTLGLPSAGPIPIRALRPRMLSLERPRSGPTLNRFVVESARAPSCDAVRENHPRPEPPPPRLLHERVIHTMSAQGPGVAGPRSRTSGFHTGFSGLATALPISATHVRRAGTPASRESSSARGSRLGPRSPSDVTRERVS
jgi:hypothetical protein